MVSLRIALILPAAVLVLLATTVTGFAGISADISIVGLNGGKTESLPQQYVKTFRRWTVVAAPNNNASSNEGEGNQHPQQQQQDDDPTATMLLGTDSYNTSDGFVDPTSTEELWWPDDLATVEVRPTLDVLIKNGNPSYLFGGVSVRVPGKATADGREWTNYGVNSQPLAKQWANFGIALDPSFRVECFVEKKDATTSYDDVDTTTITSEEEDEDEIEWEKLGDDDDDNNTHITRIRMDAKRTQAAVETIVLLLSTLEDSSPLASGFHILSCPISEEWHSLPTPPGKPIDPLKLPESYKLVCFATAEPDAEELLRLDEGLVSMSGTSVLSVNVSSISPGSESDFLPDAYKPMYLSTGTSNKNTEL
jgi:hypothetical protein